MTLMYTVIDVFHWWGGEPFFYAGKKGENNIFHLLFSHPVRTAQFAEIFPKNSP